MATSSIIDHIVVHNPRALEEWAKSLEAHENESCEDNAETRRSNVMTEDAEIRAFMQKALARQGIQL